MYFGNAFICYKIVRAFNCFCEIGEPVSQTPVLLHSMNCGENNYEYFKLIDLMRAFMDTIKFIIFGGHNQIHYENWFRITRYVVILPTSYKY